jgi:hypothetical protein
MSFKWFLEQYSTGFKSVHDTIISKVRGKEEMNIC